MRLLSKVINIIKLAYLKIIPTDLLQIALNHVTK